MNQLNFFSQIDSAKKQVVIDYLVKSGFEFTLKIRGSHYKSKVLSLKDNTTMVIHKFFSGAFKNQEAIVTFDIREGKFYFRSNLNTVGHQLYLEIPREIFQLQRRNDFRLNLSPNPDYVSEIVRVNKIKTSVPVELRNLSLGGCQIALNPNNLDLKQNDEISMRIFIKNFDEEDIPAMARHIKPDENNNSLVLVGIQFLDPDTDFLTNLHGLLIYIDRIQRHRTE